MKNFLIGATALLSACAPSGPAPSVAAPEDAAERVAILPALEPTGPAQAIGPEAEWEGVEHAASVVQVDHLENGDAKLFAAAGGDPAINGLHLYFARFVGTADGWRVFPLGDFAQYEIERQSADQIVVKVQKDSISDEGAVTPTHYRLLIKPPGETDQSLSVTPAK